MRFNLTTSCSFEHSKLLVLVALRSGFFLFAVAVHIIVQGNR